MTWRGGRTPDDLPTLGWGVLDWMTAYLPSPSDDGEPLVLTDEQARHVLDWYTIDPRTGEFLYRRDIIERAKGWGKSPLVGAIALAELGASNDDNAAPVIFDGWDADGEPVGRPWGTKGLPPSWIQIAAVSEDQTDNTYAAIYSMLVANDHRAASNLGIDDGRTRLYVHGKQGHRLEPVTASAGSREGQRVTFAVLDETHLWTSRNGGVKLARTIRRNAAKMSGRTIETTNAPTIGEKSVAEKSGTDAERGFAGILHYATRPLEEPQPDWSDERLLAALNVSYGDAHWIDRQRILKEIRDPSTDWDDALRFFFNIRSVGSGRAVDPRVWDAQAQRRDVAEGTLIGLGFDGSVSRDATVLRACTEDGYRFTVGIWERPKNAPDDWKVPRKDVADAVHGAFARYRVGLMLCDTPYWRSEVESWQERYGDRVLAFDTAVVSKFSKAVDRWRITLAEGNTRHDGDERVREHVIHAFLRKVSDAADEADGRTKYILDKGEDKRRIDGAIADVLALEAASLMEAPPSIGVGYIPYEPD